MSGTITPTPIPTITILSFHPLRLELPASNEPIMAINVQLPPTHIKVMDLTKGGWLESPLTVELPMMNILVTLSDPTPITQVAALVVNTSESWENIWLEVQKHCDELLPIIG